jgi:hypothetical protein
VHNLLLLIGRFKGTSKEHGRRLSVYKFTCFELVKKAGKMILNFRISRRHAPKFEFVRVSVSHLKKMCVTRLNLAQVC